MIFDPNNPFDIAKLMFEKPNIYRNEVFEAHKKRHFFLLNRRFSIQFPLVAEQFNKMGVNSARALDYWQTVAEKFKKVPNFFYISAKSTEKKEKPLYEPKEEVVKKFLEVNEIGDREYKECMKYNKYKTIEALQKLEKQMETHG